jgi:hypothetical protein
MTPTLGGRLQTRIFVIVVIGGIWIGIVGPALPRPPEATLADVYEGAFWVLAVILVAGLVWELVYHGLQQFRWEKDWPTLYGLLTGINEGLVAWYLTVPLALIPAQVPTSTFVVHFVTTWLVVFLWTNGPMRVPFIRWRFRGGRLV